MPPWKPQPGHGDFADARRLSDEQIALLQRWVDAGTPEGGAVARPDAPPDFPEWAFGAPDLIVTMPEPYLLAAEGSDSIRSFVLPVPQGPGRFVRAVEFHPGSERAVHHANIKIDSSGSSRRLDAEDAAPGFDGSSRDARFPDGYFLGWTPGQRARSSPSHDDAWYLPAGADLVVELHLTPTGKAERVQASIGLFLTASPPARVPFMIRLGSQRIDIAAGTESYVSSDRYVLPVDVDLLAVQPHAHNLARSVKGYARLPDGRREWLIDIQDWDFRWQEIYRYAAPVRLPRGTVLEMEFTYDNSSGNPRNPNQPPRRVMFGQTSTSEMGDLWLQVAASNVRDRTALESDYTPKMLDEDIAGDETMLLANPGDSRLRLDLGFSYLAAGRVDEAIGEFERSLQLDPASAAGHYELGIILMQAKRLDEAESHLRRTLALQPASAESYNALGALAQLRGASADAIDLLERSVRLRDNPSARFNMGRALADEGRLADALEQYRAALVMKPDDPDTEAALAAILARQGQALEAVRHYREALRLKADHVGAMTDLAWMLATTPDGSIRQPAEAVELAETAVRLTNSKNAVVLETLAVACFEAGRVRDAIATAREAADLAAAARDEATAARLRQRLRQFQEQVPRP